MSVVAAGNGIRRRVATATAAAVGSTPLLTVSLYLVLAGVAVLPIAMLLLGSLRQDGGQLGLEHYAMLAQSESFRRAFANTVISSGLGAALSLVAGSWLAFLVTRTDIPAKGFVAVVAVVPFFVSAFVHALAWSALADPTIGILNLVLAVLGTDVRVDIGTIGGVAFVQGLYHIPFVYLFVSAALHAVDPSLEEAARTSGAGIWRTVRRVTIPLVSPAILSAGVLVFALMAGNFAIPSLLGTPANLEFVTSFLYQQLQLSPPRQSEAAAAGTLLMVVALLLYLAQRVYVGRRNYVSVTGKGFRPRIIELGRWRAVCIASIAVYVLAVIVVPLAALGLRSTRAYFFVGELSDLWNPDLMSLRNFAFVLEYDQVIRALVNTGLLAVGSAAAGAGLYFLLAYAAERMDGRGSAPFRFLVALPSAVPGMVLGLSYLWIALYLPLYGTIWILLLSYIARFMPQGAGSISASLRALHPELEESARVSGAGVVRRLWRIVLPLARQGIFSAVVLCFVLAITELHTSVLLYTSKTVVLSVVMYEFWQSGQWGAASALSLIQSLLVVLLLFAARLGLGAGPWAQSTPQRA
ncbi:MAG: iron ABC transporter permease [Rhodospirillales bacterium]|nr:iron ABC transporter permease [Rhodospirillales bacterium]